MNLFENLQMFYESNDLTNKLSHKNTSTIANITICNNLFIKLIKYFLKVTLSISRFKYSATNS